MKMAFSTVGEWKFFIYWTKFSFKMSLYKQMFKFKCTFFILSDQYRVEQYFASQEAEYTWLMMHLWAIETTAHILIPLCHIFEELINIKFKPACYLLLKFILDFEHDSGML